MANPNEVHGKQDESGQDDDSPHIDKRTEQDGSLKVHGDKLERLIPREKEEHSSGTDTPEQ
jgi:hypothetical protein